MRYLQPSSFCPEHGGTWNVKFVPDCMVSYPRKHYSSLINLAKPSILLLKEIQRKEERPEKIICVVERDQYRPNSLMHDKLTLAAIVLDWESGCKVREVWRMGNGELWSQREIRLNRNHDDRKRKRGFRKNKLRIRILWWQRQNVATHILCWVTTQKTIIFQLLTFGILIVVTTK